MSGRGQRVPARRELALLNYLINRMAHALLTIVVVSVLVFSLLHFTPGDPVRSMATPATAPADIDRLRMKWGLDRPLPVQYGIWVTNVLQGDFGQSVRMRVSVSEVLWPRFFNTLRLTAFAMAIALVLGIGIGIAASVKRGSIIDTFSMIIAVSGFSIPPFWLGLILILLFSVHLGWFPAGGGDSWRHIVLPALSLAVASMSLTARITRSAMLEVLTTDYIRTARAKGLDERRILWVHALKNASIPIVTIVGLQFGILMSGAVVTEIVFSWPGIGWLLVNGILDRDFPVVQASLLVVAMTFVVINFIVDALYTVLDPRIRYDR